MEFLKMNKLFKEQSQTVRIFMTREIITDPYEKNVEVLELSPLPLKAIVSDIGFNQITWKMPGIITDKAKEIIIQKKHRDLLESSYKIQIDNDYYEGWRLNGKLQLKEEAQYIRAYLYLKKV